jgi:hypothetical protein
VLMLTLKIIFDVGKLYGRGKMTLPLKIKH